MVITDKIFTNSEKDALIAFKNRKCQNVLFFYYMFNETDTYNFQIKMEAKRHRPRKIKHISYERENNKVFGHN